MSLTVSFMLQIFFFFRPPGKPYHPSHMVHPPHMGVSVVLVNECRCKSYLSVTGKMGGNGDHIMD